MSSEKPKPTVLPPAKWPIPTEPFSKFAELTRHIALTTDSEQTIGLASTPSFFNQSSRFPSQQAEETIPLSTDNPASLSC